MSQSSNHQPNQPQETTPTDSQSPTPSTNEDFLKSLMAAMAPVVDFHKTVENASDDDLRVFWDVRLVQGKDTPFTTMSGHSSFPGILSGSSLGQLPAAMSREIVEKIAVPLAARLQDMTNARALGAVMKNVKTTDKPPKVLKQAEVTHGSVTANDIVAPEDRNEIIDVMLPKEVVAEAANIMSELNKHE